MIEKSWLGLIDSLININIIQLSCEAAAWAATTFAQRDRLAEEDDEIKTMRWIMQFTKDCPKCGAAIEKNMGW